MGDEKAMSEENQEPTQMIEISRSDYESLKEQEALAKRYLASLRQLQADFENFRRIAEKNREFHSRYGNEQVLKKLITIQDDLLRAIEMAKDPEDGTVTIEDYKALLTGLGMIAGKVEKLLVSEGIRAIESAGKPFDPYRHEVIMVQDTSKVPEGTCVEEIERGYYYKDRIIRPSKVKVSRCIEPKKDKIMIKVKNKN